MPLGSIVITTSAAAAALPALSFAQGLPQLENPTRGTGNGIMETIRNYGYDIIMLVALLVVASMFIGASSMAEPFCAATST